MTDSSSSAEVSRRSFLSMCAAAAAVAAVPSAAQAAGQAEGKGAPRVLVTYFSATGTTAAAAKRIAAATGAALQEIVPAKRYTSADLNWNDHKSRSYVEMHDAKSRPAMANPVDTAPYDVIFVGYPIWWAVAPTIINTFLESADLAGKTVVPFCTSGGSGLGASGKKLASSAPKAVFKAGREIHSSDSDATIASWARGCISPAK